MPVGATTPINSLTPSSAAPAPAPPLLARLEAEYRTAPVTGLLIAANIVVFAITLLVSARGGELSIMSASARSMFVMGANDSTMTIAEYRVETLVTACFLHFSLLHLLFNMMALRQAGALVESAVGSARFFPMYLIAGVLGSVASAFAGWLTGERLSAGASGAICGVIGAALVLGIRTQGLKGPLTGAMGRWLGTILFIGFLPGLRFDNAAHMGGTIGGVLVAFAWRAGVVYGRTRTLTTLALCTVVSVGVFGVLFVREHRDPLLTLSRSERSELAERAAEFGNCPLAREAVSRALVLDPTSERLKLTQAAIRQRCALH